MVLCWYRAPGMARYASGVYHEVKTGEVKKNVNFSIVEGPPTTHLGTTESENPLIRPSVYRYTTLRGVDPIEYFIHLPLVVR
jgi:hypothetical protein